MSQVVRMAGRDLPYFDFSAACELQSLMGRERFRQMIEDSVFQMIDRVCLLENAIEAGDLTEARQIALKLSVRGAQTGLEDFAFVASDLATCCEAGDVTAVSAVAARLVRLGETGFFSVLQMADGG